MTKEEFLKEIENNPEYSPGWQAIDDAFEMLYPGQTPVHYGTELQNRAIFGGDNYLDGYSIYNSQNGYFHIVSYGMTELYGSEEAFGGEYNGWGYEMTIKIKENSPEDCLWAIEMLSNLARFTYKSGQWLEPERYMEGKGTSLHIGVDSLITALIFVKDTEVETQYSVYGETGFIQLVGITEAELNAIKENPINLHILVERMKADGNTNLVTDMYRTKSYL